MSKRKSYSMDFKTHAIQSVFERVDGGEDRQEAIKAVAAEVGCSVQALTQWMKPTNIDQLIPELTRTECDRLKELERLNHELMMDNEILRKACAIFAQAELDH